jgi:hypothetical protein
MICKSLVPQFLKITIGITNAFVNVNLNLHALLTQNRYNSIAKKDESADFYVRIVLIFMRNRKIDIKVFQSQFTDKLKGKSLN